MKTIKFIGGEPQQKQFVLAVRKNVNAYFRENGISTKGNLRLAIQTVVMLLLYLTPFALLFVIPMNAWTGLLMAALTGIGMAGVGMCILQAAVHGS